MKQIKMKKYWSIGTEDVIKHLSIQTSDVPSSTTNIGSITTTIHSKKYDVAKPEFIYSNIPSYQTLRHQTSSELRTDWATPSIEKNYWAASPKHHIARPKYTYPKSITSLITRQSTLRARMTQITKFCQEHQSKNTFSVHNVNLTAHP